MEFIEFMSALTLNHWILVVVGALIGILIGFILKGTVNFSNAQKHIDLLDKTIADANAGFQSLGVSINDSIKLINITPELEGAREELDSLRHEVQLLENGDFKVEKMKIDSLIRSLEELAYDNLEQTDVMKCFMSNKDFESARANASDMDKETKKARAKVDKYTRSTKKD